MKLRPILDNNCSGGHCPSIFESDRGTVVVQGYRVADADGMEVPDSETLVEIPRELLSELFRSGYLS